MIRTTQTMIVKRFADFRRGTDSAIQSGPADVYYARAAFQRAAEHYGWVAAGEHASPMQIVKHCGDHVELFEVLCDSIQPIRVRYL